MDFLQRDDAINKVRHGIKIAAAERNELEHRGRERSATIDGIATVVRDAYARGMDRPSPLLTRQGVKRGISTCDLGVDYE